MQKIGLEAILDMANFNRGLGQYKQGVSDMEQKTEQAGRGMQFLDKGLSVITTTLGAAGLAVGAAGAAFAGLKKVMEFGKEGAIVSQTRESFDRLMSTLGVAPDILQQMRNATNGTVDDMTLMSSTLTLVAGTSTDMGRAMVNAAPKLLEIAKAANKLNPELGDTAFLYKSLATGIKRASPMILDNLGLTIKIGEANEKYAAKLGKTVDAMTAEDKQMALLTATLEAGDVMINQVGGSTEAMGDSFAQAEVKMKNATDTIKANLTPALADAFGEIAEGTPKVTDAANQIIVLMDAGMAWVGAALAGKDATEAFNNVILDNVTGTTAAERAAQELNLAHENIRLGLTDLTTGMQESSLAMGGAAVSASDLARSANQAAIEEANMAAQAAAAAAAEAGFKSELDALHAAIAGTISRDYSDLVAAYQEVSAQMAAGAEGIAEMTAALADQKAQFEDNVNAVIYNVAEKQIMQALEQGLVKDVNESGTAYDEASGALVRLAEKLGLVDEGTVALTETVQGQVEQFLLGQETAGTMAEKLDTLSGNLADAAEDGDTLSEAMRDARLKMQDAGSKAVSVGTQMGDLSGRLLSASSSADTLTNSLNNIPRTIDITVVYHTVGTPPGGAGPGGNTANAAPFGTTANMPARTGAGGAGGRNTTNNVSLTFGAVTIASGMDQATFEARVELAVARAVRGI